MRVWYKSLFYESNRALIRLAARAYLRIEVVGSSIVPRTGALILASNHASVLDPPLIGTYVPRQVTFLAKEELFRPPLKWYLNLVEAEPIRRGRADVGAMRAALRVLERDETVLLFPEGTRTRDGALRAAKAGLGLIVATSQATVVPAWIGGTFAAMPPGARFPRPTRVRMVIGQPIAWSEWGSLPEGREGYRRISDRVMKEIFTLSEQYAIKSTQPYLEESRRNLFSGPASV